MALSSLNLWITFAKFSLTKKQVRTIMEELNTWGKIHPPPLCKKISESGEGQENKKNKQYKGKILSSVFNIFLIHPPPLQFSCEARINPNNLSGGG
jgi:hypothetical protein